MKVSSRDTTAAKSSLSLAMEGSESAAKVENKIHQIIM